MIAVFGIGPLLDMLFGRDPANPDEETQTPQLLGQGYYVLLTLATVPVLIGTLVCRWRVRRFPGVGLARPVGLDPLDGHGDGSGGDRRRP